MFLNGFFFFHSELSHDNIYLIQAVDQDLVNEMKYYESKGILNSTVLVVMGDRGSRFGWTKKTQQRKLNKENSKRKTQQSKVEERLLFFSIVWLKWFKAKFFKAYKNLVLNLKKTFSTI